MNTQQTADSKNQTGGWAVVCFETGKGDGWYARREEAEQQLAIWRAEYPGRRIGLVRGVWPERSTFDNLADAEWLARKARGE